MNVDTGFRSGITKVMQVWADELVAVFRQAREFLTFQGKLGFKGLSISSDVLTRFWPEVSRPKSEAPRTLPKPFDRAELQVGAGLDEIRADLGACVRCKLARGRTHIVFGTGPSKARLMFIGEGPGRDEDLQGEPFVGAAGQLLDRMIAAMGLKRSDVYIANVVKCRPPNNRDPEPDEVAACEPFLRAQIRAVNPEVIVILGRCATQALLRDERPISRQRGVWRDIQGIPTMPTYHPAYLLRRPDEKKPVWLDLQAVMQRLGLSRPKAGH